MHEIRWTHALACLLLAACSSSSSNAESSSNDGGAATDSGDVPADSDGATIDAGASALDQAKSYANGNVACTSNSDCCVVFDYCRDQGLVVGVADQDKVAALCSQFDEYEDSLGSAGLCYGCTNPAIEVSCVNSKCIGTMIPVPLPDGGDVDPSLMGNHCGSTSSPASGISGSILGC